MLPMETTRMILAAVYSLLGAYVLYWLLFRKNPYQEEYEKLYNEILSSDKYKVKGQYEKRD